MEKSDPDDAQAILHMLKKYPSPHMIAAMSGDVLIADASDIVGRKVFNERPSSNIYASAAMPVELPVHADSDAVRMIRLMLAGRRSLIRQRNQIETGAVESLPNLPNYQLLTTIPGIGPKCIQIETLLCTVGSTSFRTHKVRPPYWRNSVWFSAVRLINLEFKNHGS